MNSVWCHFWTRRASPLAEEKEVIRSSIMKQSSFLGTVVELQDLDRSSIFCLWCWEKTTKTQQNKGLRKATFPILRVSVVRSAPSSSYIFGEWRRTLLRLSIFLRFLSRAPFGLSGQLSQHQPSWDLVRVVWREVPKAGLSGVCVCKETCWTFIQYEIHSVQL